MGLVQAKSLLRKLSTIVVHSPANPTKHYQR